MPSLEYSKRIPMRTLALLLLVSPLFAADYDVLVRNARVIDGSGNPWFRADLAVKDGRIAAIGRLPTATATRTIDARERVLAPGFIDVHTHIEGGVERTRAAIISCSMASPPSSPATAAEAN